MMSVIIHTFGFPADNIFMISGTLLNSVTQALSAVLSEDAPQLQTRALVQATLSTGDGYPKLNIANRTFTLKQQTDRTATLPQGKVSLVRDAAQTAVILETMSNATTVPTTQGKLSINVRNALLEQGLAVLTSPLTALATVNKDSKANLSITLPDNSTTIYLPPKFRPALKDVSQVEVAVYDKTRMTLTVPSRPPIALNLSPEKRTQLSHALLTQNLAGGIRLSSAPVSLQAALGMTESTTGGGSVALTIQSCNNKIIATSEHTTPIARLKLSDEANRLIPQTSQKHTFKTGQLPLFQMETNVTSLPPDTASAPSGSAKQITALAHQLLQHTGSTNQALKHLLSTLSQIKVPQENQTDFNKIVQQLRFVPPEADLEKLTTTVPKNGINLSASTDLPAPTQSQIKAFAYAAFQPITQTVINQPSAPTNFNNALIALFQLVRSARTISGSQTGSSESSYTQTNPAPTDTGNKPAPGVSSARLASDLSTLDKQFGLLGPLKTLLANHQSGILSNAESRSQGQDQLYFCLPFRSEYCTKPPEILIKRDSTEDNDGANDSSALKTWSLTMKLEAGDMGEVLAKSKISGDTINLHLYASTTKLLEKIQQTLPMLTERFAACGLNVESASAQQGKIPQILKQSPYRVFEITA